MVKHNNVVPFQHFHKKWARRVKTWLEQPIQKKIRRDRRKEKAAALAPRPASGPLRPVVHCPTQKYNSKLKLGRGFTLEELKAAGINRQFAQTVGIAVDHRRTNKCEESLKVNVDRLKEYKSRLIVFPRNNKKVKNGEASKTETANAQQLVGDIIPVPKKDDTVTFVPLTEELKSGKAYAKLRAARSDARLVGIRLKKSKEEKKEGKDE
jgi:large subunit ribosomal protein L13e